MKKNRTHERASDKAQISISLPRELLKKIDESARAENRPRSNWLQHHVGRLVERTCNAQAPTA